MKIVISDANCLMRLDDAGLLWLLQKLYTNVFITPTVVEEFGQPLPDWLLIIQPHTQYTGPIRIDRGEASALALAVELETECLLLTDDQRARRAALLLGVEVRGTLGILLVARQRQLVPSLAPILAGMRQRGFWVTDELISKTLRDAGDL